jgi:hypothetical protein
MSDQTKGETQAVETAAAAAAAINEQTEEGH